MDPDACLSELLSGLLDDCSGDTHDKRRELRDWIRKGGFEPDWSKVWKRLRAWVTEER